MLMFIVYLADVVGGLTGLMAVVGAVTLIGSTLLTLFFVVDLERKPTLPLTGVVVGFLMILTAALLPTKDGIYRLTALYGVQETVTYLQNNDDTKRLAGKSIQAVEKMLDEINGGQDAKDK